jgi:hypothetical protein
MYSGTNGWVLKAASLWAKTDLQLKMSTDNKRDTIRHLGGA